jgi:hypothetical protein
MNNLRGSQSNRCQPAQPSAIGLAAGRSGPRVIVVLSQ